MLALAVASTARADEPPFWGEIAHPERDRQRALIGESVGLVRASAFSHALPLLKQATDLVPDDPFAWYLLGVAQRGVRQYAACADALLEVERLDPAFLAPTGLGTPPAGEIAGECLALAGRIEDATVRLERVVRTTPAPGADADILSSLGDCYQALGRLEDAIDAYRRALSRRPQDPLLVFSLAVALDRDEQLTRARETAQAGLRLDPQLLRLRASTVVFVPPGDLFYVLGFAHLVAWSETGAPERRSRAIVAFRRYQREPAAGMWRARVADHLARLGPATLGPDEIQLDGAAGLTPADKDRLTQVVLRRAPELQACVAGYPAVAVRARVLVVGPEKLDPKGKPANRGTVLTMRNTWVESVGLDALPDPARDCVDKLVRGLRFPAIPPGTRTQVTLNVIAI